MTKYISKEKFRESMNKVLEIRCDKCNKLIGRWINMGYAEDPSIRCLECVKAEPK